MTKKTNLKNGLLAAGMFVIMPIAGVIALASCGNPVIPTDENCDCAEQEHDAACACGKDNCDCTIRTPVVPDPTCACPADKEHLYDASNPNCCEGTDCACRIYYGEVVGLTNGGKNVRIYKEAGANITDDQMAVAVANIQAGYNALIGTGDENNLNDKITEIHIVESRPFYYRDNNIVEFKYDVVDGFVTPRLMDIVNGLNPIITFNKQPSNTIKLAKVPTPRQLVAYEKSQRITRTRIGQVARTARTRMI
jgi:hypothetical protein